MLFLQVPPESCGQALIHVSSHSQAKELQICFQLTNRSKGEQPITEYFSTVKMLADTLAATGALLLEKEYVTYLLNGLGPSYKSFITSVTTKSDPVTATKLYHLLLIHELDLIKLLDTLSPHLNPQ